MRSLRRHAVAAFGVWADRPGGLVCLWGSQVERSGCLGLVQSPVVGPGVHADDVAALLPGTSSWLGLKDKPRSKVEAPEVLFFFFFAWHFQSR